MSIVNRVNLESLQKTEEKFKEDKPDRRQME